MYFKGLAHSLSKVNHLTGYYLIMNHNNTLPLQDSMVVIVRLLPTNVAGLNPIVATFLIIFIYKVYLYFKNYTTHNKV